MQRNLKLGLAALVAIAGGHYAYWWWGTQVMQKALQTYATNVRQKGQTFTYEATPTGYPFKRELMLRNVALVSQDKNGHITAEFRVPEGVVVSAGNGVTDKTITVRGNQMPFEIMLERDASAGVQADVLKLKGSVEAMENRASMAWSPSQRNVMTSQLAGIRFQVSGKNTDVTIANISQTYVTAPDDDQSVDYRMVMAGLNAKGQESLNGQTTQKGLNVGRVTFGFRMSKVVTRTPVLHQFVMNLNNVTSVEARNDPATGKPQTYSIAVGNMDLKGGAVVHDNLQDFTLGFKMGPLKGNEPEAGLLEDVQEIGCSLSYSNMPNDIVGLLQHDKVMSANEVEKVFVSRIVEAMVKQEMSFAIDECKVNAKALTGELKGMLSATEDGYPNVMLRMTATGEAAAELNAMKGMMMPSDGAAPSDKLDVSVLTVSNTLMVDGKPLMPLPPLSALAGMMGTQVPAAGAAVPAAVDASPSVPAAK